MSRPWRWLWPQDLHTRGWMELRTDAQRRTDTPAATAGGDRLRVVTYNVHWRRSRDVQALAARVRAHPRLVAADVVLLQEAESHPSEPCPRTQALADALGLGFVYVPVVACEDGSQGNAILSRHPISQVRFLPLQPFAVAGRPHPRAAIEVKLELRGCSVYIYNVHLDTRLDFEERWRQLLPIVETALTCEDPVVIGGDFNTLPFRWWKHAVPSGFQRQPDLLDAHMQAHGFERATHRTRATHESGLRLDSVYFRGLEGARASVLYEVTNSDHYPVCVDWNWPAP